MTISITNDPLGKVCRAIEFYKQSLTIKHEIGDQHGQAHALWNTSLALDKLGYRTQAIAHAEAALRIYEQIEDPYSAQAREQLAQWRNQEPPED